MSAGAPTAVAPRRRPSGGGAARTAAAAGCPPTPAFVGGWAGAAAATGARTAAGVGAGAAVRRRPLPAPAPAAARRAPPRRGRRRAVVRASASSGAAAAAREPGWRSPAAAAAATADADAADDARPPPARARLAASLGVLRLAAPEWRSLAVGLAVTCGSTGAFFLRPAVFGAVLDLIAVGGVASIPRPVFVRQALSLGALYLLCCVLTVAEVATIRTAGERVVARLRRTVFARIVGQEVAAFDATPTGELLSRLTTDTQAVQAVLTGDLARAFRGALEVALGLGLSWRLSPTLTGSLLVTVPLTLLSGAVYGARTKALAAGLSDAQAAASTVAAEQLAGIRVVKAFGREGAAVARWSGAVARIFDAGRASAVADAVQQGVTQFIFSWSTFVILFWGSKLVAAGTLTVGSLITFAIYSSNWYVAVACLEGGGGGGGTVGWGLPSRPDGAGPHVKRVPCADARPCVPPLLGVAPPRLPRRRRGCSWPPPQRGGLGQGQRRARRAHPRVGQRPPHPGARRRAAAADGRGAARRGDGGGRGGGAPRRRRVPQRPLCVRGAAGGGGAAGGVVFRAAGLHPRHCRQVGTLAAWR